MIDLETRLEQLGNDLRLDRPVTAVIGRGRILRRRRRLAGAAAVAVAAVAAGGAVPLLSHPSGSYLDPADDAATRVVPLSATELSAADGACRASEMAAELPTAFGEVLGAGRVGHMTLVIYHTLEGGISHCNLTDGAVSIGGAGPWDGETPTRLRPLAPGDATVIDPLAAGHGALVEVGRVDPSVMRVTAQIDGRTIEASIGDGWYWFAVPAANPPGGDNPHNVDTPEVRLTAYDADGHLVDALTQPAVGNVNSP